MSNNAIFIKIRRLGFQDYESVLKQMQQFTAQRDRKTIDEIWITEHPAVFTLGYNGKQEHILDAGDIPVIQTDRGGQVTYHGPGQLVMYLLIDIDRCGIGIRSLVRLIEQSIINYLAEYKIIGHGDTHAPGVYVGKNKIAALGLRVRRGRCYHGLALNIDMELHAFLRINPCGYANATVTQINDFGLNTSIEIASTQLLKQLLRLLII